MNHHILGQEEKFEKTRKKAEKSVDNKGWIWYIN